MPDIALLGLILVAIVIGYFLGGREQKRRLMGSSGQLSKDYFVGLNYLINEQTDEAIDVFIKALDINNDTVDTYLALGSLFSKRGEVEKSIRVHQDLLARPSLTSTQSFQVQLALAFNYSSAGLLDRAECILIDLSRQNHELKDQALQQLLKVYEQEREWAKAADVAERLRRTQGEYFAEILAHYYCEQCQIALDQNDRVAARRFIRLAFSRDKNSVRASLLLGQMEFDEGAYKEAIKVLQRILVQDISFMPLSLPLLEKSFEHVGSMRGFGAYLGRCLNERPGTAIIIAMTRLLLRESGESQAVNFLTAQLERRPTLRGLNELIDLRRQFQGDLPDNVLALIQRLMDRMLELKPVFSCGRCGFSGKKMHWQCPRCHCWGTVTPIQGFEGE
ncbi:lipopolysaccharide assembly protein LapB [Endozoicomonas sp. SCSIO W0465]|uniref:lipopolysaccharide assembly protein LapB n=1 Tax=Endozoicomonas sp. SCSIO W0465 TaxID=2918516 RepID=UPI002075D185|nr:lipopolysaccharide assembly protein LapB [Endozoicomonas sp. SCSIO W0465]USE39104.1 lipopolysaccharide assembly protein LapB [Endozoicomonas sp. SCSIO W0465]